ncbi:hypothetical protein ACH5RR_001306 [Cinchona calisaya]|uniref:Retrotransposon gag domain-containing protein n=1 Tax=Cinchona calisaya TaxID=153742 RepID=A0ABD3B346_9GENT
MGETNNLREHIGYRKPYSEWIDWTYELPRGYRFPDFTKFLGDDHMSIVEHIGHFIIHCGEVSNHDFLKLMLFPYSLTGTAFEGYTRLLPNSIEERDRMEDSFNQQFYHCQLKVRLTFLAKIVQRAGETANQYVKRFKTARMRCNARIPEE